MASDVQARAILVEAFPDKPIAWYQVVQGFARSEGGKYGSGWKNSDPVINGVAFKNRGEGSNNWGGEQCGHSTTPGGDCGANCFPNVDWHMKNGARTTPYQGCFKKYAAPTDGAKGFVYILTDNGPGAHNRASVAAAMVPDANGNINADAVARATYATGYHELPATAKAKAIVTNATIVAQSLGEQLHVFREADMPSAPDSGDSSGSSLGTVEKLCLLLLVATGFGYAGWSAGLIRL